jgi:serine/threonine protein kinase
MTQVVSLPGFTSVALLQEGTKAILYRAVRETDHVPVIIKGLRSEACTPNNIEQLKHEYAIAQRLNTSKTINTYALELYQGLPYLILEDFGGRSLDQLLDRLREPIQFLKIALQIVAALAQIHERQIVHKDIKPKNIIVHPETHQVKIGDFGIAAFIPYEQQFVSSSSRIEGSLPYLSPEQTGRMNRGIDYRSDLYSLGVTFYEMLTGQLPFQGNDPLEWVHCHIAKQPPSLREFNIPSVISDLVLKLLAKVAEERYQSALGLQVDLERCLQELETTGDISPFMLGEQDVSDRLQIPEKLYGRESEMGQLLEAFERVVSQGTPELMLISGYAGVGKSSLVNELHKPIVRSRGIFISGKFDQYKRDIPYATIVQAFQTLVRQLLTEPEDNLAIWKTQIQTALGNNGKLITDMIPEVEWVIGEQPPVPEVGPAEAQNRFNLVFQNFIGLFASKEHPLAVFLDDMQWADSATLNLIQTILSGSSLDYLCFVLAYRDNEVDLAHPFSLMLDQLRQLETGVTEIILAPLNLSCVNQLIAETLHCSPDRSEPLAQLVIHKTDGNPFFVNELLKTLYQDSLIRFNYAQHGPSSSIWQWDLAQIEALGITDNIVSLMIERMQKLPTETQHVLKVASCIGNHFDLRMLAILAETSADRTAEALWEAVLRRFIVPTASSKTTSYRFYHDRIQQAAYSLIADDQKQAIHLTIGRVLLNNIDSDQLDEQIFDVVNQLNRGLNLIAEPAEKAELLRLNLIAGEKAKASTAYTPAKNFLAVAATLLPENAWSDQYEQTFTLFLELAECLYLIGELAAAEELFNLLLLKVQSTVIALMFTVVSYGFTRLQASMKKL